MSLQPTDHYGVMTTDPIHQREKHMKSATPETYGQHSHPRHQLIQKWENIIIIMQQHHWDCLATHKFRNHHQA
eukprot:scaffold80210_cov26-Prasinocladus_malaysianus.AAC.1